MNTDIRSVADAILYEGYLLYPYRSTSLKNRSRWQFGVLGPERASETGVGEESTLSTECLVETRPDATVDVTLRFLQLQDRRVERRVGTEFVPVDDLTVDGMHWLTWEEAVEVELNMGRIPLSELSNGSTLPVSVEGDVRTEDLGDAGRIVRSRHSLCGEINLSGDRTGNYTKLHVEVSNTGVPEPDRDSAMRSSFIGTHLVLHAECTAFSSLLEPEEQAAQPASDCHQHRCFPVLAGKPGSTDNVLVSPIILYDYPEIAEQSEGALFDSTEIDEILTLRVLTMTDTEKAEARATDPRAAEIIDRCDAASAESMQSLHGDTRLVPEIPDGMDWWEAEADSLVEPETDAVLVQGVLVAKDSLVRVHPSRRADAQDLFFEGRTARVASVHEDVDGDTHVGVVMLDDPAADLHGWYGRYLYFAPDELEPVPEECRRERRT
ncbi:hypothetical protein [Rhodococcoides kyotonense]|uniref:Uncharacterized protein n=1 Tax=Rhodococcoides kyotonense TaxID=398843 RepID=A0A239JF48_9NOCA|nr:hypothetical protein [Rhodococcus kyotonensis]SNT04427.1 hypothetical protein SAMN05421642_108195 [Rhodococcus kyotonensis]